MESVPAACRNLILSAVKLLETNAALAFRCWLMAAILRIHRAHGPNVFFQNLVFYESHTVLLADQQLWRLGLQPLLELHFRQKQHSKTFRKL
jgi:hypothetical protein